MPSRSIRVEDKCSLTVVECRDRGEATRLAVEGSCTDLWGDSPFWYESSFAMFVGLM